jgi:hypothetical protein
MDCTFTFIRMIPGPLPTASPTQPSAQARSVPELAEVPGDESDADFQTACGNANLDFAPEALGFLPSQGWKESTVTFGTLVDSFFRRKGSARTRFLHKLFNALRITEADPAYFNLVGVRWVTERIIRVDKVKFARLLGLRTPDGALFHRQGNFPSHGFAELTPSEARAVLSAEDCAGVDFDTVRLFVHRQGNFFKGCGEEIEKLCRWENRRRRRGTFGPNDD